MFAPATSSQMPMGPSDWETTLDADLARFCREDVYHPWLDALRILRGESLGESTMKPFLALGPRLPTRLIPWLISPFAVRLILGKQANMITIVLNRAHNGLIFLGAERAPDGLYTEMIRLDTLFPEDFKRRLCQMLLLGEDALALDAITQALHERDLDAFRPDLLKISDIDFFADFAKLAKLRNSPLRWAACALDVAHHVLSRRLLYFYPAVPIERLLRLLRPLAQFIEH